MGFRSWNGWARLDDLDRRSGFGTDRYRRRTWFPVLACVVIVVLWFIKGLTRGETPMESFTTVLLIVAVLAVGVLGFYALEGWLIRGLGDHDDR